MDNITLVGQEGQVVCERCEIAESSLKRVRGLSDGRSWSTVMAS